MQNTTYNGYNDPSRNRGETVTVVYASEAVSGAMSTAQHDAKVKGVSVEGGSGRVVSSDGKLHVLNTVVRAEYDNKPQNPRVTAEKAPYGVNYSIKNGNLSADYFGHVILAAKTPGDDTDLKIQQIDVYARVHNSTGVVFRAKTISFNLTEEQQGGRGGYESAARAKSNGFVLESTPPSYRGGDDGESSTSYKLGGTEIVSVKPRDIIQNENIFHLFTICGDELRQKDIVVHSLESDSSVPRWGFEVQFPRYFPRLTAQIKGPANIALGAASIKVTAKDTPYRLFIGDSSETSIQISKVKKSLGPVEGRKNYVKRMTVYDVTIGGKRKAEFVFTHGSDAVCETVPKARLVGNTYEFIVEPDTATFTAQVTRTEYDSGAAYE
jgi:hypothetical protein